MVHANSCRNLVLNVLPSASSIYQYKVQLNQGLRRDGRLRCALENTDLAEIEGHIIIFHADGGEKKK